MPSPCTSCRRRWKDGTGPGCFPSGNSPEMQLRGLGASRILSGDRVINPLMVQEASAQGKCSVNSRHRICTFAQSRVINGSGVFVPSILC